VLSGKSGRAGNSDVSIDFPAMPDAIELSRSANYQVTPGPVTPDGLHLYNHTEPMQIPISFSLHAFDQDYCKDGAMTLLSLAARLHALVLPINDGKGAVDVQANPRQAAVPASAGNPKTNEAAVAAVAETPPSLSVNSAGYGSVSPPPTCLLDLFYTQDGSPGLRCVGYVKDVKVILKGPFLRGPNASYNLPSSAEFSFTFVHRPGHSNNQNYSGNGGTANEFNAYSSSVLRNFYNNAHQSAGGRGYIGIEDKLTVAEAPAPVRRVKTDTERRNFSENFYNERLRQSAALANEQAAAAVP